MEIERHHTLRSFYVICFYKTNIFIHIGRNLLVPIHSFRFYDGSGGNNHAVDHYSSSGYPLAVKLGTITNDGKADVYSYSEDDMVEDPNLIQHLAHWGK